MLFIPRGVPGVGEIRVAPTPLTQFVPCGVNLDGTPRCPPLPADSPPPQEFFPVAAPWTPAPATREDVVNTLSVDDFVLKIDSVARALGVTPGGYFARRSRLECWDVVPTGRPRQ